MKLKQMSVGEHRNRSTCHVSERPDLRFYIPVAFIISPQSSILRKLQINTVDATVISNYRHITIAVIPKILTLPPKLH